MQKQKNKEKGITLIALVVSIVVLIILAGVSIAMLVGENGIITQAQRADELTTQAQQKEAIELAIASVQAQGTLELDKTKLETALQSQLGDTTYTLTENRDGSFLLQIAERSYYIDSTGEVITQENMIAIGSAEELKAFRDDVNSGNTYEGKYLYLTGDITLDSSEQWETIGIYNKDATIITDERNTYFSGVFDGCNHKISGIYINTEDRGNGLFGIIKNGKVQNLGITNSNFIINHNAGAITGFLQNSEIINCYSNINVTVQGNNLINIGGIVGNMLENSEIKNSYNISKILASDGSSHIGGIVGGCTNSSIKNCYNNAEIIGDEQIGGIVGYINNSIIINCYNSNNITGNSKIGSIMGELNKDRVEVTNCYYLENTVNGTNETEIIEGITVKTSEQLKKIADTLGNAFKENMSNINNGYPILAWQ